MPPDPTRIKKTFFGSTVIIMTYRVPSFVDRTQIVVRGGDGGGGIVSFASTRGRAKLGADGGRGGVGGGVWLVGDGRLQSLGSLRRGGVYGAEHGGTGGAQKKKGAVGGDLNIGVPLGVDVWDLGLQVYLGSVHDHGQRLCVAQGGRNGLGNVAFLSPTNQRPREATAGKRGQQRTLLLQLRVLADIGLAGLPNAGKSSLLRCLSRAKPQVADYPFTTLRPHLGMMQGCVDRFVLPRSWTVADVPGLLPGAHQGKGLGKTFLQHLEKTWILACVVEAGPFDAVCLHMQQLQRELTCYGTILSQKPRTWVVNKMDLLSHQDQQRLASQLAKTFLHDTFMLVSALHSEGILDLRRHLEGLVLITQKQQTSAADAVESSLPLGARPSVARDTAMAREQWLERLLTETAQVQAVPGEGSQERQKHGTDHTEHQQG